MITKKAVEAAQKSGEVRVLAHYGLSKVAFNPMGAVKGVGRALGMGAKAPGVNALSSYAVSRGLGNDMLSGLGHAAQGFHQAGGTKALGNLALAGGLTYGAGRLFGAGQAASQPQPSRGF